MSPCEGCHAGCCRSLVVAVTGADLLRIERDEGVSIADSLSRWADPEGRLARGRAPHFRFADDPRIPYVIGLPHTASDVHPGTSRCVFLEEEPLSAEHPLGRAHCGISRSRPLACRTFPARFDDSGELVVLADPPPSSREQEHPVYALCPRPWRAEDVDPIELPRDLAAAQSEREFFHTLARYWNKIPRRWEDFAVFLRWAYGRRIVTAERPAELKRAG